MGTVPWTVYAPTRRKRNWNPPGDMTWREVERKVKRLQMRIAKAAKEKRYRKMRSLQWLLAHSRLAKLLAIRRVTSNKGKNTPGVDGVIWRTPCQKLHAVKDLRRRGYRASPLRRVYIQKKSGKLRPLGIPTMRDRAMQALYALCLEPVAETWADGNSYGFRPYRQCADAMEQVHRCLCGRHSAQWVLEADIASRFDTISHQWMMDNIPIDGKVLGTWLGAGYFERGNIYPTLKGTPQGGIISPLLMNMTLDGMEKAIWDASPHYLNGGRIRSGIKLIRYADDFIVTAKSPELIRTYVQPMIEKFLEQRGLTLSAEKTRITWIYDGFDFLGQHVRKYSNDKLIIKPSRSAIKGLRAKLQAILRDHRGKEAWTMIERLNRAIKGWAQFHRHACSSRTFRSIDERFFWEIKRWLHYRHPDKGLRWMRRKYYRRHRGVSWSFFARRKGSDGRYEYRDLTKASWIPISRHVKIRAEANPYDPEYGEYFSRRKTRK